MLTLIDLIFRTPYNLRTGTNITMPQQKTTTYQNSFFPKSIKDWNEQTTKDREIGTINTYRDHHKKNSGFKVNVLYHLYSSKAAINHTRIRLGLSGLASQRFDYKHITDPKCIRCNAKSESPAHFFLTCPSYSVQRADFIREICQIFQNNNIEVNLAKKSSQNFVLNTILRGSILLDDLNNGIIFFLTQLYIQKTQRFP